jgi:hypothetical protein
MITRAFTYAGLTFDPLEPRSGYKASAVTIPEVSITQVVLELAGQDGLETYNSWLGQTVIRINGVVMGTTESDLSKNIDALMTALNPHTLEAQTFSGSSNGFAPLQFDEGAGVSSIYYAKPFKSMPVVTEEIPKQVGARQGLIFGTELQRQFSAILFCKDPNKYNATTGLISVTVSVPSTSSGESAYPFTYPVIYGATIGQGSTTITNTSTQNQPVSPQNVIINGPIQGPSLTNETTGQTVSFTSGVNLTNGQTLALDFVNMTAIITSGGVSTSVIGYLNNNSVWWQINPGSNTILLQGSNMTPGTTNATFSYLQPA